MDTLYDLRFFQIHYPRAVDVVKSHFGWDTFTAATAIADVANGEVAGMDSATAAWIEGALQAAPLKTASGV